MQRQHFVLEEQRADHAAELDPLFAEPAVHEFTDSEPPPSLAWLEARFRRLESRRSPDGTQQWLNWVIRLPDGSAAGYVQATIGAGHNAEIAFVLGVPFWGQGLAWRATARMLDLLVRDFGVTEFTATADTRNARSVRLLKRLGFRRTGTGDAANATFQRPASSS